MENHSSDVEMEQLPDHDWIIEEKTTVFGKNAGKKKYFVKLIIGPYIFGRFQDKEVGGLAYFSCNSCSSMTPKQKNRTFGKARKVSENEDGRPTYQLQNPIFTGKNQHKCESSQTFALRCLAELTRIEKKEI